MTRVLYSGPNGSCEFEYDSADRGTAVRAFEIVWDMLCRDRGTPMSPCFDGSPEMPLRHYVEYAIRAWQFELDCAARSFYSPGRDQARTDRAWARLNAFREAHQTLLAQENPT